MRNNRTGITTRAVVTAVVALVGVALAAFVEVHNHSLTDNPRLFYLHYWAVQDGVTLAKTLRTALDATNVQPAG
jgi:hypothetical protein